MTDLVRQCSLFATTVADLHDSELERAMDALIRAYRHGITEAAYREHLRRVSERQSASSSA